MRLTWSLCKAAFFYHRVWAAKFPFVRITSILLLTRLIRAAQGIIGVSSILMRETLASLTCDM